MHKKLETGTSVYDKELDRILSNGMTRRQIIEKVLNDPNPGLRGDAKWAALIEGARLATERAAARKAAESDGTQS